MLKIFLMKNNKLLFIAEAFDVYFLFFIQLDVESSWLLSQFVKLLLLLILILLVRHDFMMFNRVSLISAATCISSIFLVSFFFALCTISISSKEASLKILHHSSPSLFKFFFAKCRKQHKNVLSQLFSYLPVDCVFEA